MHFSILRSCPVFSRSLLLSFLIAFSFFNCLSERMSNSISKGTALANETRTKQKLTRQIIIKWARLTFLFWSYEEKRKSIRQRFKLKRYHSAIVNRIHKTIAMETKIVLFIQTMEKRKFFFYSRVTFKSSTFENAKRNKRSTDFEWYNFHGCFIDNCCVQWE